IASRLLKVVNNSCFSDPFGLHKRYSNNFDFLRLIPCRLKIPEGSKKSGFKFVKTNMRSSITSDQRNFHSTVSLPSRLQSLIFILSLSILISRPVAVAAKNVPNTTMTNEITKASWQTSNEKQCNIYDNETLH